MVIADDGILTVTGMTHSPAVMEAVPVVVRQVAGVNEVRSGGKLLRLGSSQDD